MTHEEILTTLGHYVDYLIAGSTEIGRAHV